MKGEAIPGTEPLVLLSFSISRVCRVLRDLPGVTLGELHLETLRIADADAVLVLEACGLELPPSLQAIAAARRAERERGLTRAELLVVVAVVALLSAALGCVP